MRISFSSLAATCENSGTPLRLMVDVFVVEEGAIDAAVDDAAEKVDGIIERLEVVELLRLKDRLRMKFIFFFEKEKKGWIGRAHV